MSTFQGLTREREHEEAQKEDLVKALGSLEQGIRETIGRLDAALCEVHSVVHALECRVEELERKESSRVNREDLVKTQARLLREAKEEELRSFREWKKDR